MADIDIDADELNDAAESIMRLNKNVQVKVRKFAAMAAQNLINRIERNIQRIFTTGGRRKPDQISLKDSFTLRQGTNKHKIRSSAPHALPLEEGASRHDITPNDSEFLTIPTATAPTGVINKGHVVSDEVGGNLFLLKKRVDHPGNGAYRYILASQQQWAKQYLEVRLPREMRRAITRSGFTPEGI